MQEQLYILFLLMIQHHQLVYIFLQGLGIQIKARQNLVLLV